MVLVNEKFKTTDCRFNALKFHLEYIGTVQSESIIYSSFKNGKTWKSCILWSQNLKFLLCGCYCLH